jgi:hypothetical protein
MLPYNEIVILSAAKDLLFVWDSKTVCFCPLYSLLLTHYSLLYRPNTEHSLPTLTQTG